ncbi:2'-5' RNA ligase family protein [bacterium]|nr:2'-5' RNA ligase family protein [bacterium]MCB2179389.1 2'-5' RNA ligase family protein [bacterium]
MTENLFDTGRYEAQVYAVVAMFDELNTARVKGMWSQLAVECGLKAINATPFPHFSFHIAQSYDLEALDVQLRQIAAQTPPFSVRTTGLSVFTGPEPVVYVSLVASQPLLILHQRLWEQTSSLGERVSGHYRPGYWVPHITLANRDVTPEGVACIMRQYSAHPFTWEIHVSQLGVLSQRGSVGDIYEVYPLAGA